MRFGRLLILIICVMAIVSGSVYSQNSKHNEPNDPWRFGNVKEWKLTLNFDAHDELTRQSDDTTENFKLIFGGKIIFKLTQINVNNKEIYWSAKNKPEFSNMQYVGKYHYERVDPNGEVHITDHNQDAAGPLITGPICITIYPEDKQYDIPGTFMFLEKGSVSFTSTDAPSMKSEMPMQFLYRKMNALGGAGGSLLPLPESGMLIEKTETYEFPIFPFTGSGNLAGKMATMTLTWSLTPWTEEAGEPKISLKEPDWLPEDGKQIMVEAKWKGVASRIKYTLYDVSKEKGKYTNDKDKSEDPDISISSGAEFEIEQGENTWTAYGKVAGDNKSAIPLDCHDYGARAKVKCEVKINGNWETAKTEEGKDYLTIPLDKDENSIGDKWERDKGISGLPPGDDNEKSPGNSNNGDGLTLYEEYRGIMANGSFTRLHPKDKDLIVANESPMLKAGINLFAKAAGFKVTECKKGELDEKLVVNPVQNSVAYGGKQCGIYIHTGNAGGAAGLTVPRAEGATFTASPKAVLEIIIDSGINNFGAAAGSNDIAHELGHACGLRHHGDAGVVMLESNAYDSAKNIIIKENMTDYVIYSADGFEITERPFMIPANAKIGWSKDTPASGDTHCIMCYDSVFSYSYQAVGGKKILANKPVIDPGTIFCVSPAGNEYNEAGHNPFSLFGDASTGRGNCKSKLRIKDWK